MPIHDWTRVDDGVFHNFHQIWTISICTALNGGLLPKGFTAMTDQRIAGVIPDVVSLRRRKSSDPPTEGGGVVTATRPQTRFVRVADIAEDYAARANRISIHHPLGRVISIIEVVSPGNKSSEAAITAFVNKVVKFLNRGIHVLVVDLFPPTPRDPEGIHKTIWDQIKEEPFELPPDKPLTLAAYVASIPKVAYVEPVAVGDPLPMMPVYLDAENYVPLRLEDTYQHAWATCTEDFQEVVEKGISFEDDEEELDD